MKKIILGDCTLYLGDCLEVMKEIPDKSVDAVITDPPYNLGIDYGKFTDDNRLDYAEWCSLWFFQLERICIKTIAISCGVTNWGMWNKIKEPIWTLCWHKPFSVGHGAFGFSNWEPVIIYGTSGKNERQSDYFQATFVKDKSAEGHPCPKPINWGKNIAKIITKSTDTILDPFMGSGTTGVACVQTGRKFIGIEIEKKYFDIAVKRIKNAQQQIRLPI